MGIMSRRRIMDNKEAERLKQERLNNVKKEAKEVEEKSSLLEQTTEEPKPVEEKKQLKKQSKKQE